VLGTDIIVILFFCAQFVFVISAFLFAISAIDDFFIDIYFYFFLCIKKKFRGDEKMSNEAQVSKTPQQYLAVMLPAWQEGDIIVKSVTNIIRTLEYERYHIFIGTYPNDQQTQTQADYLSRRFDCVHKVVTPLPGPTCKADCLNSIVRFILNFEKEASIIFSGFILQDAEDIVHKASLKIFNHFLTKYDLVQIPVYSLKRKWYNLTASHYMDEFAEFQGKEIRVREQMAKVVPGAGVGTAYSREAVMAFLSSGEIFKTNTLTEDYEFSLRLYEGGYRQVFARLIFEPSKNKNIDSKSSMRAGRCSKADATIATREYFPSRFWAAVRQKTRWTIGISLQGWKNFKWRGNWRIRYLFWRDRKMLFFSQAIVAGFFALSLFGALNAYHLIFVKGYHFAPLLRDDSLIWYVVYFNLFMMVFRITQRCYWTVTLYGWSALPMLPFRYMWGALINYLAITRAIKIFFLHQIKGEPIGWDKTAHDFPEDIFNPVENHTSTVCPIVSITSTEASTSMNSHTH
jgi:adsorption protein B